MYLDANWEVMNVSTHKRKAKLFSTSVSTGSDAASIVDAMDKAFGQLEEDVAERAERDLILLLLLCVSFESVLNISS